LIEVNNLVKNYGKYQAVKDISFKVYDGEVLGFLGPNGAGKSTTMNIITGYISATSGEVKIGGFDILANPTEAKKKIGYLPEIPPVYIDMTVTEYLHFVAELKGVAKDKTVAMLDDIMGRIKITHVSQKLIKNLSKGYRQRVGLAQAMVGYPEVLILDEPTVGLDPKQIIEIREVIKELSKEHTIILSSHILSEISAVCNRVMIINSGQIVAIDTPEDLSSRLGENRYEIRIKGDKEKALEAFKFSERIAHIDDMGSKEEGTWDFVVSGKENVDVREEIFNTAVANNIVLLLIKNDKMSLEDIFLQVTEGEFVKNDKKSETNEDTVSQTEEEVK